jgi:AraC-like DNA-binding protein
LRIIDVKGVGMLLDIPLTRAAGMGPLPEMLEEVGGFSFVNRVFALAGLPTVLINDRTHWVPLSFLADLFRFGSQAVEDPFFGLHVGQRMAPEQFGKWAEYGLLAPTVGAMIRRLEATLQIHTRGVSLRLSPRDNGRVAWEYAHSEVSAKRFIHHCDHIIPVILKALWRFLGPEFRPTLIEAPYRCSPSEAADREELTSLPWSFGKTNLAVVFPEKMLSAPRLGDETSDVHANLEAELAAMLDQSQVETQNVAMRVDVLMLLRLLDRKSDIEGLARLLGLSTRGLQRDLTELGRSYRKMLSKVRMQRAKNLIETTEASLTEIALELDYSDLAHFSRAFKLHFGYPPSDHGRDEAVVR